ncbi:hypothetical protein M3Y97_00897200 [Aphelenchoides bicaudatus]|nr:hypothetical protein M3Y97_00897200 [Aphelenchoides bicaudatus]
MGISVVASLAIFTLLLTFAAGLRCKCTQSSNKAPCQDGICDVNKGGDSPLLDGTCDEKVTKSGVTVKYCSCTNKDFCNYERWPDSGAEYDEEVDHPNRRSSNSSSNTPFLFASLLLSFMSLTVVHFFV